MNFLEQIRESLREHEREDLCEWLGNFVNAKISGRGRPEESVSAKSGSLGVIDIAGSPIRWVNVRKISDPDGGNTRHIEYGIPDSRLDLLPADCRIRIETIRVKRFPLIGAIVGLRWKGNDSDLGILSRLINDRGLAKPIMDSDELIIEAHPGYGCWVLSVAHRSFPSARLWQCYESIARHLTA